MVLEGLTATSVPVSTGNFSQSGENLRLKIDADLDSGPSHQLFIDSGATWTDLTTDGTGLTEIANITFGAKTGIMMLGVIQKPVLLKAQQVILFIESIILSDVSDAESPADLVNLSFEDINGTKIKETQNSGTATGAWNYGGPQAHNGTLNIGHTQYYSGLIQ